MEKINYWKKFYEENKDILNYPSEFCTFVIEYFKNFKNLKILDAGCGNGRDSYFLGNFYEVVGVDLSTYKPHNNNNCKFEIDDFCTYSKKNFDLIYSRFTFHSITNDQHEIFLKSIKAGSYLCIETRSDKGQNSFRYFGDSHFRNLTNYDYLVTLLKKNNFEILFIEEADNFAIYKNENPICIRVICKKIEIKK